MLLPLSFLAKQGLLRDESKVSQELTDEQIVEKKRFVTKLELAQYYGYMYVLILRLEAMEVCKQYDQEVQGSQGVDVS